VVQSRVTDCVSVRIDQREIVAAKLLSVETMKFLVYVLELYQSDSFKMYPVWPL
jgi:hypothetical protein